MRFWRRKARENELERELRAHLELEAEEQRESGVPAEEAAYAAQRAFGNTGLVKESVREVWGWLLLESLGQDLRYAFRSLRGSPVFAFIAIWSLGLGIGANTAIFSFVNAILLKRLPVPNPEQLVQLEAYENGKRVNNNFSFPFLAALNKRSTAFDGVAGRFAVRVSLAIDNSAFPLNGELVTGNYFDTLQVKPALGRLLTKEDIETAAANPLCVISYALWQGHFAGDPQLLGGKLLLNGHSYTVIGVTERGFYGPQLQSPVDVQMPASRMADFLSGFFSVAADGWKAPNFTWLYPLARLKPGVTMAQAQAMTDPLARAIRLELTDAGFRSQAAAQKTSFRLTDGSQGSDYNSPYAKPVTVLMGVVILVLLIACANLANLLLARAGARAKEFAVRLSLGASRGRLIRQLMVESLAIAACGGALGLLLAYWIVHTLLLYLNTGQSAGEGLAVAPDPLVIGFSLALSLLTALLFGLAPAWQAARPDLVPELKGTSSGTKSGVGLASVSIRRFLIVFQIALSLTILFSAGLLTRTLSRLKTVDLGFDPARVITLKIDPGMNGYSAERSNRIFDQILSRLRAQPGIAAASFAMVSPLGGDNFSVDFSVPGQPLKEADAKTYINIISPDYFKTLNLARVSGRDFDERDGLAGFHTVVVNRLFARQFMPGLNPLGQHFKAALGGDVEIVGVVKDSRYRGLRETPVPLVYFPAKLIESSSYSVLVRTRMPGEQALANIRQVVRSVDPKLPIFDMQELQEQIDRGISSERVLSFLSALFSVLATLLCSIGIYGLIAYAVSHRKREIGVRFAIGAQKSDVAGLFLRESLLLVAAGALVGVPLALASTGVLQSVLFGVTANDAVTLTLTVLVFMATGLLASVLPVWKATRIEPVEALRYE